MTAKAGDLQNALVQQQQSFIAELQDNAKFNNRIFDENQLFLAQNALIKIDEFLGKNGKSLADVGRKEVYIILETCAYLGINMGAVPAEGYYQWRNEKNPITNTYNKIIEFNIQGKGFETLLYNFGRDINQIKSFVIYEGDEYTLGSVDGWEVKLPTVNRKYESQKPLYVVYLVKTKPDGEIVPLIASRGDVKKSLLANAKQSGADENKLRELEKVDIDTLLTDPKYVNDVIKKEANVKNPNTKKWEKKQYTSPLFSPAYTSVISRESMIETKMRNHAVRRYPKNFSGFQKTLYESTYDDEKYLDEKEVKSAEQIILENEQDFEEKGVTQKATSQTKNNVIEEEIVEEMEEHEIDDKIGELIEEDSESEDSEEDNDDMGEPPFEEEKSEKEEEKVEEAPKGSAKSSGSIFDNW